MDRGIGIGLSYLHARDVIHCAALADSLGFRSIWTAEDHYYGGAFTLATAAATAAGSAVIGIGVVNPFTRHPATIAMETAALREIAAGRLILGLGSTGGRRISGHLGMSFEAPANAVAEAVQIVRRLLAGEHLTFSGSSFRIEGVRLSTALPAPPVPLFFGVLGPLSLRRAGALGDGVLLSLGAGPKYVRYAIEQAARGASASGRADTTLPVAAYHFVSLDDDGNVARSAARPFIAKLVGKLGDHPMVNAAGLDARDVKPFQEGVAQGSPRVDLVTADMIDEFVIAGTPTECQQRLSRLIEAGVTHPIAFESPLVTGSEFVSQAHRYLAPVVS